MCSKMWEKKTNKKKYKNKWISCLKIKILNIQNHFIGFGLKVIYSITTTQWIATITRMNADHLRF